MWQKRLIAPTAGPGPVRLRCGAAEGGDPSTHTFNIILWDQRISKPVLLYAFYYVHLKQPNQKSSIGHVLLVTEQSYSC